MSAEIRPHPSAPVLLCDFCTGSPILAADHNIGFELEGQARLRKRTMRAELHICNHCRAELFKPFASGLARMDALINYEPLKGLFVILPLKRVQRKRR